MSETTTAKLAELIAWARDNADRPAETTAVRELVDELDRRGAELARLRTFRAEIEGVLSHSANQGWIALGPVRDALNRARS